MRVRATRSKSQRRPAIVVAMANRGGGDAAHAAASSRPTPRCARPAAGTSWGGRTRAPRTRNRRSRRRARLGRKRVIQRRFNGSLPRTRVPENASTLRERTEG
ncbi:hypothetical protein SO694_0000172 [Aureococcus anophagefferens]|uniref:Uncharacterized protein n=1 Tax=Aureococcus anophagefferens TaxID=44056 RepID=A0ABR1GC05_AURAN